MNPAPTGPDPSVLAAALTPTSIEQSTSLVVPMQATREPEHPAATISTRRRLHPLTPVLRSARALAIIVAAISWQGYAQLGARHWLLLIAALMVATLVISAISWAFTGYHIVARELRVDEGLLWRRTRAIPLDRVQAIDVDRPVLARLAGLAELRLEVIGAAKTEAPLAYLTRADAVALRERLLGMTAAGTTHGDVRDADTSWPGPPRDERADPSWPGIPADERFVHQVANRDVLISQLLTPQTWLTPVALAFLATQFVLERRWNFVTSASTLTALVGILLQPARRVLTDWDFRVTHARGGLRLRHGLADKRTQTVPLTRVQAVRVTRPLWWRPMNWLHCQWDVAGYGPSDKDQQRGNQLLPVGHPSQARTLVSEVLPGVDIAAFTPHGVPPRARVLAPLRQPRLGVALGSQVLAITDGWLAQQLIVVPYQRVQSVRVTQHPVQRWLGLASVHIDTAGRMPAVAAHRDLRDAYALADALAERVRRAS